MPDSFKPIDMPDSFEPITIDEPSVLDRAKGIWDAANAPLVDIRSGGLKTATDEFAAEHPYIGKPMNFATDVLSSLTSPLSLGLGALTAGGSLAESAGAKGLAKTLELPGRAAGAGMVGHGSYNLVRPSSSTEERVGGLLEAGLGGLGLRSSHPSRVLEKPKLDIEVPKLNVETFNPFEAHNKYETEPSAEQMAARNLANEPEPYMQVIDPNSPNKPYNVAPELNNPIDRILQRMSDEIPVDPITGMKIYNPEGVRSLEIPGEINPKLNVETSAVTSPTNSVIQKLQIAIDDIKPLNKQQQEIYHQERQSRLAKMKDVTTPGEAGYHQQLGKLKGSMEKVTFEPIKLEQSDVDELFNMISSHPAAIGFNEIKAKTGLAKLLSGQVPQHNEIELLNRVFGDQLTESLAKNLPTIDRARGLVSEAVNLPKSLMASFDLSAPFRQGLGLAHKKEFWSSFDDMIKAFGSENGFRAVQQNIESNPNFALSQEAGLHLSELTGMTNREEAFMSNWAERIPVLGRGVRASDRAYVGFLNKLRSDTFYNLIDNAEKAAKSLEVTAKNPMEIQAAKLADPKTNLVLANEFANFVNTATGRGHLGKLESSAVALNNMFFSPRLIASRIRMLNPQTYISASPAVRKEYLKSLLAIATVGTTVSQLGRLAGGTIEQGSGNKVLGVTSPIGLPVTSDAGKVKFGDTRLDPYGGFQQYIVAATRLLSGQQESSTSGNVYDLGSKYGLPTRLDVLRNFTANKLAPVPKFAYDLLNANQNQPFTFSDEAARLFVPMVIQDTLDLANSNPKLIPALIPLSGLGMGVQTYPQPGLVDQVKSLVR